MDKIHICKMALQCIIGTYPEERLEKQDVIISASLHVDLKRAGNTDDFRDAIDYEAVQNRVISLVESSEFHLIEALAESVAHACLEFEGVEQADVLVEKPDALRFAKTVSVEISRQKTDY